MDYQTPSQCPVCSGSLEITKMTCPRCGTELAGHFRPCKFCTLDEKMRLFLDAFLQSRGNIKEVERTLSISYPTVKSLLDELLSRLYPDAPQEKKGRAASDVLTMLENGEITAAEAAKLLSEINH